MADVNLNTASFAKWNAAVSAMRLGTSPARIAFVGDSTMEGNNATTISHTLARQLQVLFALPDIGPATTGAVWGFSDFYTNEVTLGTGWTTFNGGGGWGPWDTAAPAAGYFTAPTSASGNLSFPISNSIDHIIVYYISSTSSGTCVVDVDGGSSLGNLVTLGGSNFTIASQTFTCTAGVHTINLHAPTVGTVFIMGVEGYLSTAETILCSNGGATGTATADWIATGNAWYSLNVWDLYKPDLTIVVLGINDARSSVSGATFETNITTIVTKAQTYGDVLLVGCVPSQNDPEKTNEVGYKTNFANVATAKTCGYYDMTLSGRFVDWTTANGNGYMADAYHPNNAGYTFWAGLLLPAMKSITTAAASTAAGRIIINAGNRW